MKKIVIVMFCLFFCIPSFAKKKNKEIRCAERLEDGIKAFNDKKYSRAVGLLSAVRNECIGELDAPDSLYYFLGLSYMRGKKPEDARMELRTIIEEYPHSEFIERTYYWIAYCSYKAAPIIQRDNRLLRRAEREFSSFVSAYPRSEFSDSARIYLDSIVDKLLQKEILNAEYYEITDKYESAVIYYQSILEDYAGNRRIPEIRLRLARNLTAAKRFAEAQEQLDALEDENLFKNEIELLRRKVSLKDKSGK